MAKAAKSGGDAAKGLEAAGKGMDGVAANAAGGAAQAAVQGKSDSAARRNLGRYAGAATSGAVAGASKGGAHGAVIGAAKNVAIEGAKDVTAGVSEVTGGSPDAEPADKRLGAGGTSYERGGKEDKEGLSSKAVKGAAVGGAAAAAPPAMAVVMLMALLAWLKSMFFKGMAMAMNAMKALWLMVQNIFNAALNFVLSPFIALGGFVAKAAGAVGLGVTALTAPVAAAASGAVATIAAVALAGTVFGGILDNTAQTDDHLNTSGCYVAAGDRGSDSDGNTDVSATSEANAKIVYSVLSSWGMPDENIAGILGNWSAESSIDPTSVQGFYTNKYTMTPEKKSASTNTDNGIGLGQWTFGRNSNLRAYAEGKGVDWWTIETQLAYMIDGDNAGSIAVVKDMIANSQGSPGAAALHFHAEWEISADGAEGLANRQNLAETWYGKMSGWTVDSNAANGVEDIVGEIIETVGSGVRTLFGNCKGGGGTGNVSLKDGGMTQEEAQALIDLYNEEGNKFLEARYKPKGPIGGPGTCDEGEYVGQIIANCVSFSTYFVNKYTTYQQYPWGNGIETAYSIAADTGKEMSSTPTAYSVASGPGTSDAGHTLVVLGVSGDQVIVGEAGYCAFLGRVTVMSAQSMAADGWKFVDVTDLMLPQDEVKTS